MLRESSKMALWAAHKHPIAFGEPTVDSKTGLQWNDVRDLLQRDGSKRASAVPAPPRDLDPLLAGERERIRARTKRARAAQAGKRAPATIGRSPRPPRATYRAGGP